MLVVKMRAEHYQVTGRREQTFTGKQLTAGINLRRNFRATPLARFAKVDGGRGQAGL